MLCYDLWMAFIALALVTRGIAPVLYALAAVLYALAPVLFALAAVLYALAAVLYALAAEYSPMLRGRVLLTIVLMAAPPRGTARVLCAAAAHRLRRTPGLWIEL